MKYVHPGIKRVEGVVGPLKGRPFVSLVAIGLMAVVLLASIGIFLFIEGPEPVDTGDPGSENGQLSLELTFLPQLLRSGMQEEVRGIVTDEEGRPVQDAVVSLNFSSDADDTYRTTSGPDGTFTLPFWSPSTEVNTTSRLTVMGTKDGFGQRTVPLEIEIITPLDWTIMVYMSDCDLEEFALEDINEMEGIPSGPHLNLVVQLDRWESLSPKDDRSDGNWTTTKRFLIRPDDDTRSIGSLELEDIGEINTADPAELVDFATWTMDSYPADRYALVLWNHGSGIDGICWEQSMDEEDVITVKELGSALQEIGEFAGRPLDIVGFDACLMSAIEVAYEIAPYSRYLVGSEITEPTYGWDYSSLGYLVNDPFMSEVDIGNKIIDGYLAQADVMSSRRSLSLGMFDLTKTVNVVEDLDAMSNTINSAGTTEIYNMRLARKYAQPISDGHSSDAVDLWDYTENIYDLSENTQVQKDALNLIASLDEMVLRFEKLQGISDLETEGLNGLSIYSPDFKDVLDYNEDYEDLKFVQDTGWDELLTTFYDNMKLEMEERVVSFEADRLSVKVKDEDGDFLPDTMEYQFRITSDIDDAEVFLGINVYNLRGDYINSTWLTFEMNSTADRDFIVKFQPRGPDREPGMYRIVAYMCLGAGFDALSLQDYTRSGYRWLEVLDQ
ncbi:MAG: clostripain-related cysteine peptidase [Thermoplasmatota archaeon]